MLARRRAASVAVYGAGRVGAAVATLLAAAGVGKLAVVDEGPVRPADLGPAGIREQGAGTRATAVVAPLRRTSAALTVSTLAPERADIAVVAPVTSVPPPEVLAAVRHRSHLLVTMRETTAAVGPFVQPGRTPCLRCMHLARADRDPHWAALTAQLTGDSRGVESVRRGARHHRRRACRRAGARRGRRSRCEARHGRRSAGDVGLDDGQLRRRSIAAHPSCGCGAADDSATMVT